MIGQRSWMSFTSVCADPITDIGPLQLKATLHLAFDSTQEMFRLPYLDGLDLPVQLTQELRRKSFRFVVLARDVLSPHDVARRGAEIESVGPHANPLTLADREIAPSFLSFVFSRIGTKCSREMLDL